MTFPWHKRVEKMSKTIVLRIIVLNSENRSLTRKIYRTSVVVRNMFDKKLNPKISRKSIIKKNNKMYCLLARINFFYSYLKISVRIVKDTIKYLAYMICKKKFFLKKI